MNPNSSATPLSGSFNNDLPVAYTEVDSDGILRFANPAACRLHDLPAEELLGRPIWEFVPHDESDRDRLSFFRDLASDEDPPVIRRSLLNSRGGYRSHELHRRILRDSTGSPIGIACITFDLSKMEAAHRETRQTLQWLENAMSAIPQAVLVTDALGFVRYINPAAERLTSWFSRELVGLQFEKGIPVLSAVSKSHRPLSFRITLQEPWHGDVELMTRDRRTVAVWLSASPILDQETGYTNGVVIVLGSPKSVANHMSPEP
jgi:PAS domain S-box-containing protein